MSTFPTSFTIKLPLYTGGITRILQSGKETKPTKRYWLTLNNYRNWHYQTANKTKVDFKAAIAQQVQALPDLSQLWGRVRLDYILFPPDKRHRDLMNSVTIIDKYFADALVELGRLKDDDCSIISGLSCNFGNVDKMDPRMEVTISPYSFPKTQTQGTSMVDINTFSPRKVTPQNKGRLPLDHNPSKRITYVQITMSENEIAEAIRNWIRSQVPLPEGVELPVEMVAGRGENGHTASITVPMKSVAVATPTQPSEAFQEFNAAAAEAQRKNEDNGTTAKAETPTEETGSSGEAQLASDQEDEPQENAVEELAQTPSTLFEGSKKESSLPEPDAEGAAAPPASNAPVQETAKPETQAETAQEQAPATEETEQPVPAASGVKSIFDS